MISNMAVKSIKNCLFCIKTEEILKVAESEFKVKIEIMKNKIQDAGFNIRSLNIRKYIINFKKSSLVQFIFIYFELTEEWCSQNS